MQLSLLLPFTSAPNEELIGRTKSRSAAELTTNGAHSVSVASLWFHLLFSRTIVRASQVGLEPIVIGMPYIFGDVSESESWQGLLVRMRASSTLLSGACP